MNYHSHWTLKGIRLFDRVSTVCVLFVRALIFVCLSTLVLKRVERGVPPFYGEL